MKLSDYCILVKTSIKNNLEVIDRDGCTVGYNNKFYDNPVEFLDDSVVSIIEYVLQGDVEKDIDFSEAFRESGILDGYLTYTNITSKVVADRNPLGFLKR